MVVTIMAGLNTRCHAITCGIGVGIAFPLHDQFDGYLHTSDNSKEVCNTTEYQKTSFSSVHCRWKK